MLPDLPNRESWRLFRLRRALGLLRFALLGVFVAVLLHVLGV